MAVTLGPLVLGFLLDLLIGDPHVLYHPIRLVGNLITVTEKFLRKVFPKTKKGELAAGVFLVLIVSSISTAVPCLILYGAGRIHTGLRFAVETVMCYQLLATRALKDESMKVYEKLKEGDLPGARYAVSMIVGRDTQVLDETGVTKAAVETVAENTSDGIIAPMLFMAIGGAGLGFFYKSINTMDSMVGYKNEKYLYFGRAAAKLDDVVNFLPSRIAALLM
ncbi:MAG: adenosylcobinamide-phosphate synthase CbiB, partial [Blautia sp.]|nr:adenosylcobinamide-phosphate synthase CbiB [Blautia sp.]